MKSIKNTLLVACAIGAFSAPALAEGGLSVGAGSGASVGTGVGTSVGVGADTSVGASADVDAGTSANTGTSSSSSDMGATANSGSLGAGTTADMNAGAHVNTAAGTTSSTNTGTGAAASAAGETQLSSTQVQNLQESLRSQGYSVTVDGVWGANTQAALRQFQQANNLDASGSLDAQTRTALGINR